MLDMNPFFLADFYKVGHVFQYPKNTEFVYSNLTPRKSRFPGVDHMVVFTYQYFIKVYLINYFNRNFFNRPKDVVMKEYKRRMKYSIGELPSYKHIEDLHDLGYLPIKIKALPEGSKVPMRVPFLTIVNTKKEFYWLTNFLETIMSCMLWQGCASATIAYEYKKIFNKYAIETGMPTDFANWQGLDFTKWQGHDFSFRGLSSFETALLSGMAHLLSFTGTDTIPAIDALEQIYNANCELELIGASVPATEHSVMCAGEKDGEFETFKRLVTETYPNGIVSIVSDTWDLWKVCTEYLPRLKNEILNRNGKVVIRPDSGKPQDIICGDPNGKTISERKGVVELLWDVFGGSINEKGFKVLDPHIGVIYGDSITIPKAAEILERLKNKGFASQVVFGIGSYTYQGNTRDTFGNAIKATWVQIDEKSIEIFKDPITDDGTKKSARGLISVKKIDGEYVLKDRCTVEEENDSDLEVVFLDGKLMKDQTLKEIRERLNS